MLRFEARGRTARRAPARPAPAGQTPARPTPRRLTAVPPASARLRSAGLTSGQLAEVRALDRILPRRQFGQAVYIGAGEDRFSRVLRDRAGQVILAGPACWTSRTPAPTWPCWYRCWTAVPTPPMTWPRWPGSCGPARWRWSAAANVLHSPGRRRYRGSRLARTESPAAAGDGDRVGHHPERLMLELAVCGLQVERMLSAAGLAHPAWDRVLPWRVTQAAEYAAQAALAALYAGPSLFFLARRRDLA